MFRYCSIFAEDGILRFFAVGTAVVAIVALTIVAVASLTAVVFHTLFAASIVVRFNSRLFAIGLNVHVFNTVFRRLMAVALVTAVVAAAFIAVLFRLVSDGISASAATS